MLHKFRSSGLGPTIQRVGYALRHSRTRGLSDPTDSPSQKPLREFFVRSHNGPDCRQILEDQQVDLLLLATDTIIKTPILQIPRLGTLNAHPGWIPRFRGLGGLLYQIERGFRPAVTLHLVDQGIDTGPVIVRREFDIDARRGLDGLQESVWQVQGDLFVESVKMFRLGQPPRLDTFTEPSNMTRGMPAKRRLR